MRDLNTLLLAVVMMLSSVVTVHPTPLSSRRGAGGEASEAFTAAWWNVENLFDTRNDPNTNDDEYTPEGDRHWTRRRLEQKRNGIYRTLLMMGLPDVVGMAEVENNYVLRELCQATPLRKAGYRYVHYDSPDRRGIDCALLYRQERFRVTKSTPVPLSDSTKDFYTRDLLQVVGVTAQGDTVCLVLCHLPSKRGGEEAERHRIQAASILRDTINALSHRYPAAAVIAMGDFNATPNEPPIAQGLAFGNDSVNPDGLRNLVHRLPQGWGSHKFQGEWNYLDAIFLKADSSWRVQNMQLVRYPHLLTDEKRGLGQRPKRTHNGPRYEGGISDHLPLLLTLRREHD